jgi:hypothetical protein
MAWYAVCRDVDGELISIGTVLAEPMPEGMVALEQAQRPDAATQIWDRTLRVFVARPEPARADRVQDLADDPDLSAVWQRLTVTQRQTLRDRLVRLLGPHRYRLTHQPTDME